MFTITCVVQCNISCECECPIHGQVFGPVMAKRIKHFTGAAVATSNRFEVLSDNSDDEIGDGVGDPSTANQQSGKTPTIKKPRKLPNIVVDGHLNNHKVTMESLKAKLTGDVDVRCQNNRTVFKANSSDDFHKIKEFLKESKYSFYTHTPVDEKPLHMVLKGLPPGTSPTDIQDELTQNQLQVLKVTPFSNKKEGVNSASTIMSVIFNKGTDIKKVMAVRRLYYSVISWEKYVNKSQITQCYKCLKFGHIAVNCNRAQKCLNCAADHSVKDCLSDVSKCSNCNGAHQANFKECVFQKRILESRAKTSANETSQRTRINRAGPSQVSQTQTNVQPQHPQARTSCSYSSLLRNSSQIVEHSMAAPSQTSSQNDPSAEYNLFRELKSLFQEVNIAKIISAVKLISFRLKSCNDTFEKVTAALEIIFELF